MKKIFYVTLLFSMIGLLANEAQAQTVPQLKSQQYIACPAATVTLEVNTVIGHTYRWYDVSSGGTYVTGVSRDITKDNTAVQSVWVSSHNGSVESSRVKVDILLSDYCGATTPTNCALTGSLIYKEDFRGDIGDPVSSPTDVLGGRSDLAFCPSGNCVNYGYGFHKYGTWSWALYNDDHTYPGDRNLGYFMLIDPAPSQMDAILYEYDITGLCSDIQRISFTAWMVDLQTGAARPKVEMQILDMNTQEVIVTTGTFQIPRQNPPAQTSSNPAVWGQYGYVFDLPSGVSDITFRLINREVNNIGNDWALDDIEIYLCAPPVATNISSDTTICLGSPITLSATYTDDGTFGSNLTYHWEYSTTGNVNNPLEWSAITGNLTGASPLNVSYTVSAMSATNVGYYRLAVSGGTASINNPSCRAASAPIHVLLGALPVVNLSASPSTVCVGSPSTLTAALSAGATTAMTYTWYEGSSAIGTTIVNTYNVSSVPATGNYSVKAVNSYGCEGSDTVTITAIVVVPSVTITATPQ